MLENIMSSKCKKSTKKNILFLLSFRSQEHLEALMNSAKKRFNFVFYVPSWYKINNNFLEQWKNFIITEDEILEAFDKKKIQNNNLKKIFDSEFEILQIKDQFKRVTGGIKEANIESSIYSLYIFLYKKIKSKNFDIAVFQSTPHFGYDFLIYKIFKKLNKKTLIFERNFYRNHYFLINNFDKIRLKKYKIKHNLLNLNKFQKIKKDFLLFEKRVNFFRNELFLFIFSLARFLLTFPFFFIKNPWDSYYLFKNRELNLSYYNFLCLVNAFQNLFISFYYKFNVSKVNYEDKYILWTMSVQPERNTNPLSEKYFSDYEALKEFSKINKEFKIYVKEHPRIFARNINWVRSSRSIKYYKNLIKLKNVFLIDKNSNTEKLIKNSFAVVALNGSTPFKAALLGKKSAIYGNSWYSNLKSIKKLKNLEDQKKFLRNLLKNITNHHHKLSIIKFCMLVKQNSVKINFSNLSNCRFQDSSTKLMSLVWRQFN